MVPDLKDVRDLLSGLLGRSWPGLERRETRYFEVSRISFEMSHKKRKKTKIRLLNSEIFKTNSSFYTGIYKN